ncbi:MAG: hypothetical protein Kow00107_09460 [Planctomycetota bacterium]
MHKFLLPLLLLFTLLFVSSATTEEPRKCKLCDNTGKIPVKPFADNPDTLLDSERLNYPSNDLGLGWIPCTKNEDLHPAETKAAREEFEQVRKELEVFTENRRQTYDFLIFGIGYEAEKVNHIETEHFVILNTLKPEKIYKVNLNGHQRARLYCLRLEELFNEFCTLINIPKSYQPSTYGKWQVYLWGEVRQQLKASNKMVGNTQYPLATGNARLLTITPFTQDSAGRELPMSDDELYHHVLHNVVHLLCEEWGGWVDGCFPNWFYEGVAHWVEYRTFNRVAAHCSDEAGELFGVRDKKWERLLYDLVDEKKDPLLTEMAFVKMQDLTFPMRLKGWGLIYWMHEVHGPDKLREFVLSLKKSKNEAQAWRDVLGMPMDQVDDAWRPWVKETFAPRKLLKMEKENEKKLEEFIEHQKDLVKRLPY